MKRTYKYRCYLNAEQQAMAEAWLVAAAGIYNSALQERRDTYAIAEQAVGRKRPWHPLDGDQRPGPIRLWDTDQQKYVPIAAPKGIGFVEQSRNLTVARNHLKEVHADLSQAPYPNKVGMLPEGMPALVQYEVLRRVDRAFAAYFRRCKDGSKPGYPRFRSAARRYDSLTFTLTHENHKVDPETGEVRTTVTSGAGRLRSDDLVLSGLGHLKVRWHREIPPEALAKSVVLTRSCGRWYVSVGLELPSVEPIANDERPWIGIDMGLFKWATLSNGETFDGHRAGRHKSARRRGQRNRRPTRGERVTRIHARTVSRRQKHSKRQQKARELSARVQEEERNRRRDHRHKFAHEISKRFAVIFVEDLGEQKMVRSEVGTVDKPNPRSGLKRELNRRILFDGAWHLSHLAIDYKAEEAGGRMVKVPPMNTTRLCSQCGWLSPEPITGRVFQCPACGYTVARPYNSARNIERIGREQLLASTDRGGPRPSGGNGRGGPHAVA